MLNTRKSLVVYVRKSVVVSIDYYGQIFARHWIEFCLNVDCCRCMLNTRQTLVFDVKEPIAGCVDYYG